MLSWFEITNQEDFDRGWDGVDVPLTQQFFYGEWQKSLGFSVRRFVVWGHIFPCARFQVIKYNLPGKQSYMYVPHGLVFKKEARLGTLNTFHSLIKKIAREE